MYGGGDFTIGFDRATGFINKIMFDGVSLLKDGGEVTPNFWRAPTDNDFGANLQNKLRVWHKPELKLVGLNAQTVDGVAQIKAEYKMPATGASVLMTYKVSPCGAIDVTERMVADTTVKNVPDMFRFGVEIPLIGAFENLEYYGRGPRENYVDRKGSQNLGIYHQTVSEQPYMYIRPQETGTRSDIRWWRISTPQGTGLEVTAQKPFSASALHYTVDSLDEGKEKVNMHTTEVEPQDITNLCVDLEQMGLGCVTSWGALPLPQYCLPYADRTFSFRITPLRRR